MLFPLTSLISVVFSSDLPPYIEQLSLTHGVESSRQHRRLRNLFQLPVKNYQQSLRTLLPSSPTLGEPDNRPEVGYLASVYETRHNK